ncbi:MAG: biopolymer transporter ExbD [Kiritimatiellae bacterium]|nr:biopolymer transporter ExbD [Kiritimatiellia bacterium]
MTSLKRMGEINLTPLMDLTFILLITFIITFPLIEEGIVVNLPKGSAKSIESKDSDSVTVDQHGVVSFNGTRVTLSELGRELVDRSAQNPDMTVMVRADERIKYGNVVAVMKLLHDAKITKMALVTQSDE